MHSIGEAVRCIFAIVCCEYARNEEMKELDLHCHITFL
jgi:hypothetical protein